VDEQRSIRYRFVKFRPSAVYVHTLWTAKVQDHQKSINRTAAERSSALAADATGELNVLGHDRHSLGVDGAEIGVCGEAVSRGIGSDATDLRRVPRGMPRPPPGAPARRGSESGGPSANPHCFAASERGCAHLEVLGDLPDEPLEGELADEQLCGLLVLSNFAETTSEGQQGDGASHRRATVPGLYLWGFFTPPDAGADFLAALVANCFLGALPPVDLRAVCLVRAILVSANRATLQRLTHSQKSKDATWNCEC